MMGRPSIPEGASIVVPKACLRIRRVFPFPFPIEPTPRGMGCGTNDDTDDAIAAQTAATSKALDAILLNQSFYWPEC